MSMLIIKKKHLATKFTVRAAVTENESIFSEQLDLRIQQSCGLYLAQYI